MKVTVELTDNQAARWLDAWQHWIGHPTTTESSYDQAATALASGIVAARPKPLKVGDRVAFKDSQGGVSDECEVVSFGVHGGEKWMVVAKANGSEPWFARDVHRWVTPLGSPIVWPE